MIFNRKSIRLYTELRITDTITKRKQRLYVRYVKVTVANKDTLPVTGIVLLSEITYGRIIIPSGPCRGKPA